MVGLGKDRTGRRVSLIFRTEEGHGAIGAVVARMQTGVFTKWRRRHVAPQHLIRERSSAEEQRRGVPSVLRLQTLIEIYREQLCPEQNDDLSQRQSEFEIAARNGLGSHSETLNP